MDFFKYSSYKNESQKIKVNKRIQTVHYVQHNNLLIEQFNVHCRCQAFQVKHYCCSSQSNDWCEIFTCQLVQLLLSFINEKACSVNVVSAYKQTYIEKLLPSAADSDICP